MRSCNTQSFLYLTTEYKCFSKKTNLLFFHWLLSVLQQHHGIKITQIYLGTDSAVWSIENNTSLTYSIRNILEGKKLFAFQLERIRTWLFLDLFFYEKHLYKIYLKTKVFLGAAIEGQPWAGSQHGSNGVSVRGAGPQLGVGAGLAVTSCLQLERHTTGGRTTTATAENFPGQSGANFQGGRIILLQIGVWQYPPMTKDKSPYSTSCFEGKRKKKKIFFSSSI